MTLITTRDIKRDFFHVTWDKSRGIQIDMITPGVRLDSVRRISLGMIAAGASLVGVGGWGGGDAR